MKTTINYQRVTVPAAFIAQSRQRVKQYGSTVYLRNGEEFEIELFNPTQSKVLAKIKINGNYISSSGIVLRPGERVFLERYLDEAKKFLFETYEVDGANPNVKEAIRNNGDIEVKFYEQYQPSQITLTYSPTWTWQPSVYYSNTNENIVYSSGCKGPTGPKGDMRVSGISGTVNVSSDTVQYCNISAESPFENHIETGRVEKGDYSNQSFNSDSTSFNSWYSWTSVWKILPDSQRPIMKEDLVVYCTGCGAKRKKPAHKFCPNCGKKFSN